MSDERSDRRRFLKYAGTAAVSGIAGCIGGDGEATESPTQSESKTPTASPAGTSVATHEVPHPNDSVVPDAEKNANALNGLRRPSDPAENKSGIGFQHEPKGEKYCGNCSQYVPDQTGDGFGACYLVDGKIHPCDYCILWVEYEGEDAIPCPPEG